MTRTTTTTMTTFKPPCPLNFWQILAILAPSAWMSLKMMTTFEV
jgi:hypothetical protein